VTVTFGELLKGPTPSESSSVAPEGMLAVVSEVQLQKAAIPMVVTESGITIAGNEVQE